MATIDALRALAATAVALVHFTTHLKHTWLQQACHYGWLGVDVFFVISGYVIPLALFNGGYRVKRDYPRFIAKRLIRLHPPYLATVIVLLALPPGDSSASGLNALLNLASHAFLLNGVFGLPWLLNVFWSLAIEMQYYLFIGLAAPLLTGPPGKALGTLAVILALALLPIPKEWLPAHLPLFAFGILALMKTDHRIGDGTLVTGLVVTATICAISIGKPQALAGIATALIICYYRKPVPRLLVSLGAISYSLYLLHPIAGIRVLNRMGAEILTGGFQQIMAVSTALLVSMSAAWIWFRLLESPCQKLSSCIRYARHRSDSRES